MATEPLLRVQQSSLELDLERAARGLDELDLRVGILFADFGRQTGGPGFIVSDDAVFDGDPHARNVSGA
jgi:hypothetical protein